MDNETQETIVDIIVAMRNYSNACNDGYHTDYGVICTDMRNYADRLEAAHKREMSKNVSKNGADFGQLGDAAKLREALKDIGRIVEQIRLLYSDYPYEIHLIARKANAALAATEKEGGAK